MKDKLLIIIGLSMIIISFVVYERYENFIVSSMLSFVGGWVTGEGVSKN